MVTTQKILLLLPPLVLLCLLVSYTILYASPETSYSVVAHHLASIVVGGSAASSQQEPAGEGGQQHLPETTWNLPDLGALCARTSWNPNLALHCHSRCGRNQSSFCGGISNARDRLQTCLRLALDAGATTIVLPSLAVRSETRLATINPAAVNGTAETEIVERCADAWFDLATLQDALGGPCPQTQVKIVCPTEDIDVAARLGARRVLEMPWRNAGESKYDATAGHSFRDAVGDVLLVAAKDNRNNRTAEEPEASTTLVEVGDTYMAWDYNRSGEQSTLFKDLFQTVNFSPTLRALGQRLIQSARPLRDESYIGVHLRGENDWPDAWGSLAIQTRLYAEDIETLRLRDEARGLDPVRTIYVSCGNRSAIQYFRESVAPLGYTVVDKWSLLEGARDGDGESDWSDGLLATVEALSFDEKAIVEYEPLVKSRYFLGISYSSMSYVIATARTLRQPGDFYDVFIAGGGDGAMGKGEEEKGIREVRGNEDTRLIYVNIE